LAPGPNRKGPSAEKARQILDVLGETHDDARIYLDHEGPFQLLIATILAAQCTDEKVNEVTPELFRRYPAPADLAAAARDELEAMLRPTGFFRQKTTGVQEVSQAIAEQHGGEVPDELEALTAMPGVGRKTANIVLGESFGRHTVAVDTHVKRVATRLGLTTKKAPDKIEQQLCEQVPHQRRWKATLVLGTHGRRICTAKRPDCEHCPVSHLCDYYQEQVAG
jgi:endonuclease-3